MSIVVTIILTFLILFGGLFSAFPDETKISFIKRIHTPLDKLEFTRSRLRVQSHILMENLANSFLKDTEIRKVRILQAAGAKIRAPISLIIFNSIFLLLAASKLIPQPHLPNVISVFHVVNSVLLLCCMVGLAMSIWADIKFQIYQLSYVFSCLAILLSLYIYMPPYFVLDVYLKLIYRFKWYAPLVLLGVFMALIGFMKDAIGFF
jgi:hypothetical protein